MITCAGCGTIYDDNAIYCNRCGKDLNADNSNNLFDQAQLTAREKTKLAARYRLIKFLAALAILFPFLIWFDFVEWVNSFAQQSILILVVEASVAIAALAVYKHWRWARLGCGLLSLLLLPIFPVGSVASVVLLYFLVAREW